MFVKVNQQLRGQHEKLDTEFRKLQEKYETQLREKQEELEDMKGHLAAKELDARYIH